MAVVTENVIRRLTIIAKQEGLEALKSELSKVTQEFDRTGASTLSVAKKLDTLERSVDPAAKAQANLVAGLRTVSKAMNENVVDADRASRVISLLGEKYEGLAAKAAGNKSIGDVLGEHYKQTQEMNAKSASMIGRLDQWSKANEKVAETNQKVTNSLGLTKMQAISMQQTIGDVVASAATGQSPLRILLQQGEQALQPYGTGLEGIKAAASTTVGVVTKLINPITAVGAAMAASAYAAYTWTTQTDALNRALNGLGRSAGVNAEGLRRIGASGAAAGGFSAGQGIDLAAKYAAGGVSGDNIRTLIADTQRFSHAFGVDMEKAQEEIAKIVGDSGLGAFEKRFGAASFAEKELLRSLEASGRVLDAEAEKTRLFDEQLKKATDTSWSISRAWESIKSSLSSATQALGGFIERKANGPSLQEQLASARGEYFYLNAQRRGQASYYPGEAAAEARVKELEARIEAERKQARDAARDLELNRQSQIAGGVIDATSPDSTRLRSLNERRNALKTVIDSAEALAKLGDRAVDAKDAFDKLSNQIAYFETGAQKVATDSSLATKEIEARTFADKAFVAQMRAWLDVMRESGDAIKASAAAEAARNALITEGARKLDDEARASRDELSLAGLTPYEQARKRIQIEDRDLREQYVTGSGGDDLARARESIAAIESRGSGGYGAVGPRTQSGDRAYGRYQVMGQNVPGWTRAALGRAMSVEDFLANPSAQDAVFNHQFGASMSRYGNMSDAASVWFTGRPRSRGGNARDVLGTSGNEYVRRFNANLGIGGDAKASPSDLDERTRNKLKVVDIEQIDGPLKRVNEDIERQNKLLHAQEEAFGKSTGEMARASKEQELLTQYEQNHIPITSVLAGKVKDTANSFGDLAQKQEDVAKTQRDVVRAMDDVRSSGKEALGGLINDLRQGQRFGDALAHSLDGIASKLINIGLDKLFEGALGETGKTQGGLAGGGFFNLIKGFFGFADGGIMTSHGPVPLRKYADGGVASSPQLALFGEGSGPEAYVPLKNGGIPVHIKAAANQSGQSAPQTVVAPKTEVHVHNAPPGTQVRESQNSNGTRRMDVMIAEATANSASNPMVRGAFRAANAVVRR